MAAAKKASFASKQVKAGPAPLASFEDLPSDEMDSPNSSLNDPDQDSLYLMSSTLEDLNLDSTTPGTITSSPISALHIDVSQGYDNESQHTLTPCNPPEELEIVPSPIPVHVVEPDIEPKLEMASETVMEPPKSPTCQTNLGNTDELQVNLSKNGRKGSWTDIFRSRSHSGSRSPQPSPQSPRKALPELPIDDSKSSDGKKGKKKSGILSVFRFHDKKSDKHSKSPVSPVPPPINVPSDIFPSSSPSNVKAEISPPPAAFVETKNIDAQLESDIIAKKTDYKVESSPIIQVEQPLSESNPTDNKGGEFEAFTHPELKAKLSLERKSKSLDHEPMVRDGNEEFKGSSESELAPEEPVDKKDEEEIDFEAETLLNQDSIEYDESLISESSMLEVVKIETKSLPRRQRLEITTVPIERPRSTTPISVAPFEAFIQSAQQTQTVDSNVEKLKVLLPGEQFCARLKSPKKNLQQKSWQDFCQSGLRSPRVAKRPSNEAFDNELSPPPNSSFDSEFGQKWETFEFTKNGSSNNVSDEIVNPDQSSSNATGRDTSSQAFNFKKENLKLSFSSSLSSDSNNISQENDAFDVQIHPQDW